MHTRAITLCHLLELIDESIANDSAIQEPVRRAANFLAHTLPPEQFHTVNSYGFSANDKEIRSRHYVIVL